MTSIEAIYGSQNITAAVVADKALVGQPLTIYDAQSEGIGEDQRVVLSFIEITEKLPLNKTNARTLAKAHGDDYHKWKDKKLSLKLVKTTFGGNEVDGVRVVPLGQ